jgi:hypothetical protein
MFVPLAISEQTTRRSSTPKAFYPKAQGCEALRATLGD